MTNAKLEIQISDEFNASFEAYLKEAARNIIQEVMNNPDRAKSFSEQGRSSCLHRCQSYHS